MINVANFLITIGILLPDVTLNLVPGETSAFSLAGCILWLLFKRKINLLCILGTIFIILFLFSSYSIYCSSPIAEVIKQIFAYLQICSVLFVVSRRDFEINYKIVFIVAWLSISMGIIQMTGFLGSIIDPLLKIMIPRGMGHTYSEIGRGSPILSSEPSHAVQSSYIIAFLIARYYYNTNPKNALLYSFFYLFIILILTGAGIGIFYLFVAFIFLLINQNFLKTFKVIFIFFIFIIITYLTDIVPSRLASIISVIISNYDDLINLAINTFFLSGFRLPSVYASYAYPFHNPFPLGPGGWTDRILEAYNYVGIDITKLGHFIYTGEWHATKPFSLFSNILLEYGILGYLLVISFCYQTFKVYLYSDKLRRIFLGLAAFGLLFLNTLGNPVFMSIWAFIYKDYKLNRYKNP